MSKALSIKSKPLKIKPETYLHAKRIITKPKKDKQRRVTT